MIQVEIGPGTSPHPDTTIGVDPTHPIAAPVQFAQVTPWQHLTALGYEAIDTGTVDHVYTSHTLEHIPAGQPRIDVFNEAWRVLKPGKCFTIIVPLVGFDGYGAVESYEPWADPTHVSHWWFPQSLQYFTGDIGAAADYGIRQWAPLSKQLNASELYLQLRNPTGSSWWTVRGAWEGVARLVKP